MARILDFVWYGKEHTGGGVVQHLGAHRSVTPKACPDHALDCWELALVERGSLHLVMASGQEVRLQGGRMVAIPPHTVFHTGPSRNRCSVYWLGCDPHGALFSQAGPGLAPSEAALLEDHLTRHALTPVPVSPASLALAGRLLEAIALGHPRLERRGLGLCLASAIQTDLSIDRDTAPQRVRPALTSMEADPARDWAIQDLAAACGLGRSAFMAAFRDETGFTPREWLLEHRLTLAEGLLADATLPLAMVSTRLGFSSPRYFAAVFRRLRGRTPAAWRQAALP